MKLSTNVTEENIARVLALLAQTTGRLDRLAGQFNAEQQNSPLAPGEWSLAQVMGHLIACADVRSTRIYFALLLDDPLVPDVHPQKQWERLLRYGDLAYADLMADFALRRQVFLSVLQPLKQEAWAREIRGDKRAQSVYLLARNIALHEQGHCDDIQDRLPAFLDIW